MQTFLRSAAVFTALMISTAAPSGAFAQAYPPAGIPGAPGAPGGAAQSSAAQGVRIDRLENRIRELTGQVEELQFQMRRMEQQLQKFQQDVDFRLQEKGGAGAPAARPAARPSRSDVRPPAAAPQVQAQVQPQITPADPDDDIDGEPRQQAGIEPTIIPAPGAAASRPRGRNDAFDPNENPNAPGAPRALNAAPGPYVPSAPARPLPGGPIDPGGRNQMTGVDDPNAPLDLSRPGANRPAGRPPQPAPVDIPNYPGVLPGMPGQQIPGQAPIPGQPAAAPPQNRYQIAIAALKENRLDDAEQDFRAFIDQNPKSRSVPDAIFNLGQIFEKRGRHREAAEQYLKVTQSFDKSARAPDSMLRLGLSLEKLGAKEQACATWQEAGRKYPLAPGYVRTGLERQIKRAQC